MPWSAGGWKTNVTGMPCMLTCLPSDPALPELAWLVVVGSLAAWFYGFGTGSNDVANAFGTSVGAKTLSLRQAVLIAAIFEFTGAMVLGRTSTSVIAGGIADVNTFAREPEMFAYGMVCAMTVAGLWQVLASYLEYNVSSTHSIIGCIIGFSMVYAGKDAVLWQTPDPNSFPPVKGVVPIIVAWTFTPLLTGLCAAMLFFLIRVGILRQQNSYILSFWLLPFLVTITVLTCMYFVFTKGAKKTLSSKYADWTDSKSAWVAAVLGAGCGVLTAAIAVPILKWRADHIFNTDGTMKAPLDVSRRDQHGDEDDLRKSKSDLMATEEDQASDLAPGTRKNPMLKVAKKGVRMLGKAVTHGTTIDIHECIEVDPMVAAIHDNAEVFDPKSEYVFKYLQVFSAICVEFAHGAGEVGYMAGPLAAVWQSYTEGAVKKDVAAPVWVVFIAAFGLVVGLATYGYNVTRAMGVRLAKLTATRGFCAELATATVIMICSQYGLPTSSSQCITGGIIGVGVMEGKVGVNWKVLFVQFGSWVATLFVAGLCTAALFAQGVYAPGKVAGAAQIYYEDQVAAYSSAMFDNYRATLFLQAMFDNYRATLVGFANVSASGTLPDARLSAANIAQWNQTLMGMSAAIKKAVSPQAGTAYKEQVWSYMTSALSLYQSSTVLTVGQKYVYPGAGGICNNNQASDITEEIFVSCPAPQLLPNNTAPTWPPL